MLKQTFTAFTCIAMFLGLITLFSHAAETVEIALEAEFASIIKAPMTIAVPDEPKALGGPKPGEPSRGEFIWAPGAPTTGGGDAGFAEFIVDIPVADEYAIWGYVIAWDGNSDSFWVTVRPADPDENPQSTGNTEYRWGVAGGNNWHWDRINHWLDAGTFDRKWELPKGEASIKIWSREDATMLDALFITSDSESTDQASANVRLPTDEDVKLQLTNKPVQPTGKLSITWGYIKNH